MEKLAKLIIIRGNSGSGKTTLAKELQRKLGNGTMLISQDVVRREMLAVKDGKDNEAINLIKYLLGYGRKNSKVIILEGIFRSDWYLSLFEYISEEFKESIFAYYFNLPFEETLIRHSQRELSKEFGEDKMKLWWKGNDLINIIPETILTKDLTLSESVDKIFNDVMI